LISASPLAMGLLTPQGPPAWHPAPAALRAACGAAAQLCAARGADISQLAIQHAVRNEGVATTLVGMCTRKQVQANVACAVAAFSVPEDAALRRDVDAVLAAVKDLTWASGRPENNVMP
jgi:L-galactose dehydrogenase